MTAAPLAGLDASSRDVLRRRAWDAAATVTDPEIPVLTLADLGVLHALEIDSGGAVTVTILPTYMGCPAMGVMQIGIETALAQAGFERVAVKLAYSPAWTTDMIGPEAREKLRAYGIAPPAKGGGKRSLFGADDAVACPRCGSQAVEKLSEFGSTACKALWRCTDCREPFDYFKCI